MDTDRSQAISAFARGKSSALPPPISTSVHMRMHITRVFWPAFIPLILLSGLLMNWVILIPTAFAAPLAGTSTQGNNTFQHFLQEGRQSNAPHGAFVFPNATQSQSKTAHTSTTPTKPLPSAEPPTMQPLSLALTSTQTSPAMVHAAGVQPVDLKGNDGRLEVLVPAGALDLSKASTAQGQTVTGPFTLKVTHLHGNFIASMNMLGSYQFQVLDATGQPVHGVALRQPITLVYHYQVKELRALQLDPDHLFVSWPEALIAARKAKTSTQGLVVPMTNNAKQHTLTAQMSVMPMGSTSTGSSFPTDASPPKPNFATVQGNSGNLGYSYPIQMAPGPDGFTPALQFSYSTAVPNGQHNWVQSAGDEGEGWNVSLGSISAGPINGTTYYSISGIDGVSDMLLPIPGQSGFYETEHISHLRIQFTAGCFNVWDTSGNFYQLGCTNDSLQYYTNALGRTNYRWDTNLEASTTQNASSADKEIIAHYLQDIATVDGFTSVRDASLQQVVYGKVPSFGGSLTPAGTVDFLYQAPFTSSGKNGLSELWASAYGTNYQCSSPPENTTMRCDDPITYNVLDGPIFPPAVMSTMLLQKVETFVGDDSSTSHLDASDVLAYSSSPFWSCTDWESDIDEYCAGSLVLNTITPTVYLQGTGHQLHAVSFGYTAVGYTSEGASQGGFLNEYLDMSQTIPGSTGQLFTGSTGWQYLNSYYDANSGVGGKVTYATAQNNTHGTPNITNSQGQVIDDRHDALYCWNNNVIGPTTTGCNWTGEIYNYPNDKAWDMHVVTQLQSWGTDSSATALQPATTTYNYQLQVTGNACPAAGSDTDCVGDTWLPPGDTNWMDYYDGQFQGFAAVYVTSPAGNLTVQHYSSNDGWGSATTDPVNYLSGSLLDEEVYSGTSSTGPLLQQTVNTYAGEVGTNTHTACDTSVTGTYIPCETMLLNTRTIADDGMNSSNAPWVEHDYTYDDYTSSGGLSTGTGHYHNRTQEVVSSSNALTVTQKWSYQPNDQAANGWTYYTVDKVSISQTVDSSGHIWACQSTKYDEGAPTGVPTPAEGLATTVSTYSSANCASQTNPLTTTLTGYDPYGNVVGSVDALGVANPSLYSGHGCTLATAPALMSGAWSGGHYTNCTAYDSLHVQPVQRTNAFGQTTSMVYDATQQDLPVSMTDLNGQVTTGAYSYDGSGNLTTQVKQPLESGNYSSQFTQYTACTISSTLPCFEERQNISLYSSAISHTFYDGQGRAVETRTPGPTPGDDTVVMTVYNDQANSVWKSVPFQVVDGSAWIDPNGAKDINGVAPAGNVTFSDALGRTIAMQDPNFGSAQEPGLACSWTMGGNYTSCINYGLNTAIGDYTTYELATSIDANNHVSESFTDVLGRVRYVQTKSGVASGPLTIVKQIQTQYNVLNKPTSISVIDEQPQSGESLAGVSTSMTYDDLGRLLSVTDPDQGTFSYSYDPDGHVIATTQTSGSNSRTVGVNYDLLGRPGCEQTAAPTLNATGACSAGNPLVVNTYDKTFLGTQGSSDFPIGRLTQSVATTYFPDSTSATVTQQVQTDQRGRTLNAQMQVGLPSGWNAGLPTYQLSFLYNDANQVTTTNTLDGSAGYTFANIYDPTTGSLQGLSTTGGSTANLATLAYNENAQVAGLTLLNGASSSPASIASESFNYDGNLRPSSMSASWLPPSGNSGQILAQSRAYDNGGNVTSSNTTFAAVPGKTGSGGADVQNFCYDEQNRLTWSGNGGTQPGAGNGTCGSGTLASGLSGAGYTAPFTYTNLGQLWQGPVNGQGTAQQYLYCNSAPHQVSGIYPSGTTCANKGSATVVYSASYDPWGNETSRAYNGTTATLSYDTLNHLVEWNAGSKGQEWYVYDASGNRVLKRSTSGSTTSLTAYAFGLEEYGYNSAGGTPTSQFHSYSLAGHLIGTFDGTTTTYDLTDAEGSVLSSFSQSAILGEQLYGPYGNQRYAQGTIGTDKGYTGQFNDALTGLDYYNARYYDPVAGVFLSPDSVQGNAQGMDPYAYVGGNPETRTDPTGQKFVCPNGCGGGGDDGGGTPPNCVSPDDPCGIVNGPCAKDPTHTKGCNGYIPTCADTGPQSNNRCTYTSGDCSGHTYNQCNSWKADAKAARDKKLSDLHSRAVWELVGGGVLGFVFNLIAFEKDTDLISKLLDFLGMMTSLASLLTAVGAVVGTGSFVYDALYNAAGALYATVGTVQGVIGAIKGWNWVAANVARVLAETTMYTVLGPLQFLSSMLIGVVTAGFGNFLKSGAAWLQRQGTLDLENYNDQEGMPIQDWCAQNGVCPSIASYTG